MFAVVVLNYLKEIADFVGGKEEIAKKAEEMAKTVKQAIETYGTTHIWGLGDVYAYEVDGFGQYNLMDDANVPSLLAMSYLGYEPESQEVADNTRKLILSEANPFYYSGTKAFRYRKPAHTGPLRMAHLQSHRGTDRTDKRGETSDDPRTDGNRRRYRTDARGCFRR